MAEPDYALYAAIVLVILYTVIYTAIVTYATIVGHARFSRRSLRLIGVSGVLIASVLIAVSGLVVGYSNHLSGAAIVTTLAVPLSRRFIIRS